MEVKKIKNDMGCYDFWLENDDKKLTILYGGTLDLYFILSVKKNIENKNIKIDFDITKENYEIYSLFDSLYNDILKGNIFDNGYFPKSNSFKNTYSLLVDKKKNINWISDNGLIEAEDMLIISKKDDIYRLSFFRNDKELDAGFKNPFGISIRIRNSGSRYDPFNYVFMRMYNKMQEIDPNCHQIHFEEVLYTKKLRGK